MRPSPLNVVAAATPDRNSFGLRTLQRVEPPRVRGQRRGVATAPARRRPVQSIAIPAVLRPGPALLPDPSDQGGVADAIAAPGFVSPRIPHHDPVTPPGAGGRVVPRGERQSPKELLGSAAAEGANSQGPHPLFNASLLSLPPALTVSDQTRPSGVVDPPASSTRSSHGSVKIEGLGHEIQRLYQHWPVRTAETPMVCSADNSSDGIVGTCGVTGSRGTRPEGNRSERVVLVDRPEIISLFAQGALAPRPGTNTRTPAWLLDVASMSEVCGDEQEPAGTEAKGVVCKHGQARLVDGAGRSSPAPVQQAWNIPRVESQTVFVEADMPDNGEEEEEEEEDDDNDNDNDATGSRHQQRRRRRQSNSKYYATQYSRAPLARPKGVLLSRQRTHVYSTLLERSDSPLSKFRLVSRAPLMVLDDRQVGPCSDDYAWTIATSSPLATIDSRLSSSRATSSTSSHASSPRRSRG